MTELSPEMEAELRERRRSPEDWRYNYVSHSTVFALLDALDAERRKVAELQLELEAQRARAGR